MKAIKILEKAYLKARNSAAGLTNYCEESASVRHCEKELEEAETLFREYKQAVQADAQHPCKNITTCAWVADCCAACAEFEKRIA